MKYILAILVIFLSAGVAKAGHPYYYYYDKPEFFVAQQLIPVITHHENFIDKYGDKRIKKIDKNKERGCQPLFFIYSDR